MSERFQLEYEVSVTGLGEAALVAREAKTSADQASNALETAKSSSSGTLPLLMMGVRSLNATRLAVEQAAKAIMELNPSAALYAFLNMMQVVNNLVGLMRALKESTGAASAAQAVLAALTGRWWLIPLAIAAGALVYSRIKSMQFGGLVPETGLYLLHRGEQVVPKETVEIKKMIESTTKIYSSERMERISATHINRYGPIYISFEKEPEEDERDSWMRGLEERIAQRIRRGG